MILADNGSYFYFQGVPDPRWDDNDLSNLDAIQSSNFEVVQMTPAFPGYDANTAPTGAPPTIDSFTSVGSAVSRPGQPSRSIGPQPTIPTTSSMSSAASAAAP